MGNARDRDNVQGTALLLSLSVLRLLSTTPRCCLLALGWPFSPSHEHARGVGVPCGTLGKGGPTLTLETLLSFPHRIQLCQQPAISTAHLTSTSVSGSRRHPAASTGQGTRGQHHRQIPALPSTTQQEVGAAASLWQSFRPRGVLRKMATNLFQQRIQAECFLDLIQSHL